jgi:hypothetical protein
VAYSIVVARAFLREMQASCLKKLREAITSLRIALIASRTCVARP